MPSDAAVGAPAIPVTIPARSDPIPASNGSPYIGQRRYKCTAAGRRAARCQERRGGDSSMEFTGNNLYISSQINSLVR
jgi:hypothetical protein